MLLATLQISTLLILSLGHTTKEKKIMLPVTSAPITVWSRIVKELGIEVSPLSCLKLRPTVDTTAITKS